MELTRARVQDADPGTDLSAPDLDDSGWLPVDVPGDLHTALMRAGRLPDLDHGLNDTAAAWVEDREWWWRLDVPEAGLLTCEGLDTFATLYLDGTEIGRSTNQFLPFEAELDKGGVLAICFHRPHDHAQTTAQMRKAQFSFGWDFAPRRPRLGPWRRITLGPVPSPIGFRTVSLDPVTVEVTVDEGATVSILGRSRTGSGTLELPGATLWTPDDPVLHELTVDGIAYPVGIRTVELDRTDGAFTFVLNGEPLPVRGANWVPTTTDHDTLLRLTKDAHLNMLRVWGGGVYEDDDFYATCDRLGILVWQEFMFACQEYSDADPAYVESVRREAEFQVRRLRRHPSVALWSGNNEVELLAYGLSWASPSPAHGLFYELLPSVVEAHAPGTAYVATSPSDVTDPSKSDRHNWQVWHGVDELGDRDGIAWQVDHPPVELGSPEADEFLSNAVPSRYYEDPTPFASEYGLCGALNWQTLVRVTEPEDLVLGSASVENRHRPGRLGPRNKMQLLMEATVGTPRDLREWVELSQLMQAEGDKTGVEHYRRQWPHCGGNLIWQLNDCWPSVSWALIDSDARPKPAYFAVARASAPTLASFVPLGTDWALWLTTDEAWSGELVVRSRTFDGEIRWEASNHVEADRRSSRQVAILDDLGDPTRCYLTVSGPGIRNRQLLTDFVHLDRTRPLPTYSLNDGGAEVTSPTFALHVDLGDGWSERFFDLDAGETRFVAGSGPVDLRAL